eukprot:gene5408-3895_t
MRSKMKPKYAKTKENKPSRVKPIIQYDENIESSELSEKSLMR